MNLKFYTSMAKRLELKFKKFWELYPTFSEFTEKKAGRMGVGGGFLVRPSWIGLRPKTFSYLINDGDGNKKGKNTKKCVTKRDLKFQDYKHFLEAIQVETETKQLEKSELDV